MIETMKGLLRFCSGHLCTWLIVILLAVVCLMSIAMLQVSQGIYDRLECSKKNVHAAPARVER